MQFLKTIQSSIYDKTFYRSMKEKKALSALGYFALITFIVSLVLSVNTVYGIAKFIFQPSEQKTAIREQILSLYPDDLVLKTANGKLSMNAESPYFIPMPEAWIEQSADDGTIPPENLLVINTDKPIEIDDFGMYDTSVILGEDSIGVFDPEKGKIQIQDLTEAFGTPFTVDKAQFTSGVQALEKILMGFGVAALFLIPFFVFFFVFSVHALYLIFGALVVWLAARIRGADWGYGTAYKASLYLITLPFVESTLVSLKVIPDVPWLFTIILFVMALVNITKPETPVTIPAVAPAMPMTDTPPATGKTVGTPVESPEPKARA